MSLRFTIEELRDYVEEIFPNLKEDFTILDISEKSSITRLKTHTKHLRPGNTVSGPSIFSLIDFSGYMTILAQLGNEIHAVTTNCSIDFMRKPSGKVDLIAQCEILKFGKILIVADVKVFSENTKELVAKATTTYSLTTTSRS